MRFSDIKFEVIDHDYESSCTSSCGFVYLPVIPSKQELVDAIASVDWYASHINCDKLKLIGPEGKLPGSMRLVWADSSKIAYTIKPV